MNIRQLYIQFKSEIIKDNPYNLNYENLTMLSHVREFVNWVEKNGKRKNITNIKQ
jgi:hypothetical protein